MKYAAIFEQVRSHLGSLGLHPSETSSDPVADGNIEKFEKELGIKFPEPFARYLSEVGDGFYFQCDASTLCTGTNDHTDLQWGLDPLELIVNDSSIKEEMGYYANSDNDFCTTEECKSEARRRIDWIAIMGEGNGGYRVCLDLTDGGIYSHDIRMSDGYHPTLKIAPSFDEFLYRWSRYCFSPFYSEGFYDYLEGYMFEKDGELEWKPDLFHPKLAIPTNKTA